MELEQALDSGPGHAEKRVVGRLCFCFDVDYGGWCLMDVNMIDHDFNG